MGGGSDELRGELEEGWTEIASTVGELQRRMAEQFEDENDEKAQNVPAIKIPDQPTKDQWDRHQTAHTRFTRRGALNAQQPDQYAGATHKRKTKHIL